MSYNATNVSTLPWTAALPSVYVLTHLEFMLVDVEGCPRRCEDALVGGEDHVGKLHVHDHVARFLIIGIAGE